MQGIYLTWMISALALGVILLPVFKPKWMELRLTTFVDFFRRYWIHVLILFMIYNAKDGLDEVDRILMASTGLDMTPWIYAIEGDLVLHVQKFFEAQWLTVTLTHFYVAGFMFICYVSVFYFAYFDDRWMADRVTLTIAWVYILAVPFYLFFNVRVTGAYIPEMETLAYSLNPEISDWFRRIDPFTNCMPSLHIGIPYAVWLCIKRFDHDERWVLYRKIVLGYVILTIFTIIYLGIHWILDIAGGMIVASFAVNLADKTSKPIWSILDERTINARLVTLLTSPRKAYNTVAGKFIRSARKFAKPTSRETGIIAVVILVVVGSVITWDLTHQSLPAQGVEAPEGATGADGWLATIDNTTDSGRLLKLYDLSDLTSSGIEVRQPHLSSESIYELTGDKLMMANTTVIYVVDIDDPQVIYFEKPIQDLGHAELCFTGDEYVLMTLSGGQLSAESLSGEMIDLGIENEGIEFVRCEGNDFVFLTSDDPDKVFISNLELSGSLSYSVNASAEEEDEQTLADWGTPTDIDNSTITEVVFDRNHILVTVNVSSVDRIVLIDRISGEQRLLGDGKYSSYDPSIRDGVVAWVMKDFLDPTNPIEEYYDGEILYMYLSDNFTHVLTADEIDQWGPIVLEDHLIYLEESDNGVVIKVHSWTPELKSYSNTVLQIASVVGIIVVFIYINQKQSEAKLVVNYTEEE
ncbi:MAG: phosphatase PAP2 family protein [Candidatus Thermoplasmatota archaeon]|nr:phosphatase PAP2 family protein [Candidatus Thermoplasmatota archaeon]MEC8313093.1 phosphatase PAP2 family protein [Candidatus Thermoplasmatota archaeon]